MSNSILFLAAALGSSIVLGLLVVLVSRPRRARNSYGEFSSQLHALSQATQRASDRRYESRGVTLIETSSDSETHQQGRSASGS
jgi:hypothetical protein